MRKISNIKEFFDAVERTINIAWGETWGAFSKAYPTDFNSDDLQLPLITYQVKSKRPSEMGSATEIKPRVRGELADPNNPKDVITVYGQRFDYFVEFVVWADNNDKVYKIADRFEDAMLSYTGIFKEMGVTEIVFLEGADSPILSHTRIATASRTILYKVVIDKLTPVSQSVLDAIRIQLVNEDDNLIKDVSPLYDSTNLK